MYCPYCMLLIAPMYYTTTPQKIAEMACFRLCDAPKQAEKPQDLAPELAPLVLSLRRCRGAARPPERIATPHCDRLQAVRSVAPLSSRAPWSSVQALRSLRPYCMRSGQALRRGSCAGAERPQTASRCGLHNTTAPEVDRPCIMSTKGDRCSTPWGDPLTRG